MKPKTFTQLHVQAVFAVKGRLAFLDRSFRPEVFKFMMGTLDSMGHKALAVNGWHDHVHVFYGMKPSVDISETIKEVKRSATNFIKQKRFIRQFSWQDGYGAFSYSKSHVDRVMKYIINQEVHHKKRSFREEYIDFLEKFKVEYKLEELFEFYS
ncbi:MAG: transposase [Bacteroidales bacterium]|nr:transposase [Bacteroidales bacterium]